jgi:hypothetical protein
LAFVVRSDGLFEMPTPAMRVGPFRFAEEAAEVRAIGTSLRILVNYSPYGGEYQLAFGVFLNIVFGEKTVA